MDVPPEIDIKGEGYTTEKGKELNARGLVEA